MNRAVVIAFAAFLLSSFVAGCVGAPKAPHDADPADLLDDVKSLLMFKDGRVEMEIPVQIVVVGFPSDATAKLRDALTTQVVDYTVSDLNQAFPPDADPEGGVEGNAPLMGSAHRFPFKPTARFTVLEAPAPVVDAVRQTLPSFQLDGELATYDAVPFEAFLAEQLQANGIRLDERTPSMVLLHLDSLGFDVHTWRLNAPHGYLARVTAFGEKTPLLVWDLSATKDPQPALFSQIIGNEPPPYGDRIDPATEDGLAETLQGVATAVQLRFLHGSIYPVALEECHAITLVYGYRPTNLSGAMGLKDGAALLDKDELQRAFENLTGGTVHVDAKILQLPVDDPALDAIARGEFATMEVLRAWITMNWQKYWVAHEGCEPYVSFVMAGDVASIPTGILGIGTYDEDTYRISMSWVHEAVRWMRDPEGPSPETPLGDESGPYNWVNFLFGHEVGHTIGMHHTFHGYNNDGGIIEDHTFEDVWSVMGYSLDGRLIDFSTVDRADFQRGRAAYLFATADEAGLSDAPEWSLAVDAAEHYDWDAAGEALWSALEDEHAGEHAGVHFHGLQLSTHSHD